MNSLWVILGIVLSFAGAPTADIPVPSASPGSSLSVPEQNLCHASGEGFVLADNGAATAQPMAGSTCADMGWYDADQFSACTQACGHDCVKKQWCGGGMCQPWPNYCWKCS